VEKILAKRVKDGRLQYRLKWEGWDSSFNSWEDADNLFCPELLKKFEDKEESKRKKKTAVQQGNTRGRKRRRVEADDSIIQQDKDAKVGFEHGHTPKEIIGVRVVNGELMHYFSWHGTNVCTFVPARIANRKAPLMVINFYESRLRFEKTV